MNILLNDFLFGVPVSWQAAKQKCIALSSVESEYVSLSETVQEIEWLVRILEELNLFNCSIKPVNVFCDNRSTLDFSQNQVENSRIKHIDTRYNYARYKVISGMIQLDYIPSNENPADLFTKSLGHLSHTCTCCLINLY